MQDKIKIFYDGYLDKLSVKNRRHERVFSSFDKFIPKHTRVLDIGCGTGITSRYLADGSRDIVGVDLSPVLIEYAEKLSYRFGRIKYVIGDICNFSDKPFDAIVMVDVLEHIQSDRIGKLFNVIKNASHETTKIYLNIPSAQTIKWLIKNRPKLLQIVDNPIETKDILDWFYNIGFVSAYFQFYWQQYVEYLFVRKEQYDKTLQGAF